MNPHRQRITTQSDSIMALLAAQCADLEVLLTLAHRETTAAENNDFAEVMYVVEERGRLGHRLEIYHRQIAEMRTHLSGAALGPILTSEIAQQTIRLATDIQTQDARTRPLLVAAQEEAAQQLGALDQSRRHVNAYMREGRGGGGSFSVACDQRV